MELKPKTSQSEIELAKCLNGRQTEPSLKRVFIVVYCCCLLLLFIVIDYSCAWHKDGSILIHGKVYITGYHVCFYSNILGWETKVC